jgi:hypothetical protein
MQERCLWRDRFCDDDHDDLDLFDAVERAKAAGLVWEHDDPDNKSITTIRLTEKGKTYPKGK